MTATLETQLQLNLSGPWDESDWNWDWRSPIKGLIRKQAEKKGLHIGQISLFEAVTLGNPGSARCVLRLAEAADAAVLQDFKKEVEPVASALLHDRARLKDLAAYDEFESWKKEVEEASTALTKALELAKSGADGVKTGSEVISALQKFAEIAPTALRLIDAIQRYIP